MFCGGHRVQYPVQESLKPGLYSGVVTTLCQEGREGAVLVPGVCRLPQGTQRSLRPHRRTEGLERSRPTKGASLGGNLVDEGLVGSLPGLFLRNEEQPGRVARRWPRPTGPSGLPNHGLRCATA